MNDEKPTFVVGIGASAGGIPALSELFKYIPADTGMMFVIVTHLNPHHESQLHSVLKHHTGMAVKIAQDGEALQSDTVYVMPQNVTLQIKDGRLRVTPLDMEHRERKPIDIFFASLAVDCEEGAIGIVLSGGDGDGAMGIKLIKEHGGFTFAQTSNSTAPSNPEMPNAAIATGFVDFALPVDEMAEKLLQLCAARASGVGLGDLAAEPDGTQETLQREISKVLLDVTGHDFSGYKSKTFFRRVTRRMQVCNAQDFDSYCLLLRENTSEAEALFRDLLISVTDFFRDAKAFAALASEVIPNLSDGRGAQDTIRVWVPACATGEEVYSLAMLILEHRSGQINAPMTKIFATDIDDRALQIARRGRYPAQLLNNVSPERKARFFLKEDASYVVTKEMRDLCIFSPHNVISDPPFSKMDLVSCRNLLIYFDRDVQCQVIPTLHYGLRPGGYLFLGSSESINNFGDLFDAVDKKHRIFRSVTHARRQWGPLPLARWTPLITRGSGSKSEKTKASTQLRHQVERQVLDRHTPTHVVVRRNGDVVYFSAATDDFLKVPCGAPNSQILDMVRGELRSALSAALQQATEANATGPDRTGVAIPYGAGGQRVLIRVEPLGIDESADPLFLVLFQTSVDSATPTDMATAADKTTEAAENEMREMRERLQSTREEYETGLEELKSSNEELMSVNEEAQSVNEELEASREEMQSLNEELNTINAELNGKIEELASINADMTNLLEATQIATVFLDADLMIRNFTPAAAALLNLRSVDLGRPLTDLASASDYPELKSYIGTVFETGSLYEYRLKGRADGRHYLVRLTPYLGGKDVINGAVITFVDVTSLAEAEEQQQQQLLIAELNHRVKNMLAVVISVVKLSLRKASVPKDVHDTLVRRLESMAQAYGLLSGNKWTSVDLRQIVDIEISAFGSERIIISGPNVNLAPSQALSMGMVIHELVTNAAKYGSLSNDAGRLEVIWSLQDSNVVLKWTESDGPPTEKPKLSGFGCVLIEGQIKHQLGGKLDKTFAPGGLRLTIEFPKSIERS